MMILVTGGSGSGKSAYAEDRVLSFGKGRRIYIATMYPFDLESKKRIDRHRRMRAGKGFETVERYNDLKELVLPKDCTVLLECMSNLVANEMFNDDGAKERAVEEIIQGISCLKNQVKNLVVVTNEIFSEISAYEGETGMYRIYLGEINRRMAEIADEVYEVVYGIPISVKGGEKT